VFDSALLIFIRSRQGDIGRYWI